MITHGVGNHVLMGICLDSPVGIAIDRFASEVKESLSGIKDLKS